MDSEATSRNNLQMFPFLSSQFHAINSICLLIRVVDQTFVLDLYSYSYYIIIILSMWVHSYIVQIRFYMVFRKSVCLN